MFLRPAENSETVAQMELTCEDSGKGGQLDGVGAWRPLSLEGWRNSASELFVYLEAEGKKAIQNPTTCTHTATVSHNVAQLRDSHMRDKPLRVCTKQY